MTASVVETEYPSAERIQFMGRKLRERMGQMGLTYKKLADSWEVSIGTARNTVYWLPEASKPPARIPELETALELPQGSLVDQYYAEDVDPEYWENAASGPKSKPKPRKPTAQRTATKMYAKTTSPLAVSSPRTPKETPAFSLPPVSARPADGGLLKQRVTQLERVVEVLVEQLAELSGADPGKLLRDRGIEV
ncbi:hypothetical protein [Amycolatopsis dendrobii]|uniref:Uncharacterized protein n=1 Tax=Amycolatopsis dendrobii TaxID=2760662 RepID=A0A7W3VVP0_9PSEU|nr:hypothetical protein [Amycolatopsis dendrobii]MBB1153482.1 hypothetical protein [Amycolatopsis dendrobii]